MLFSHCTGDVSCRYMQCQSYPELTRNNTNTQHVQDHIQHDAFPNTQQAWKMKPDMWSTVSESAQCCKQCQPHRKLSFEQHSKMRTHACKPVSDRTAYLACQDVFDGVRVRVWLSIYIGDDRNAWLSDIGLGQCCPAHAQHEAGANNCQVTIFMMPCKFWKPLSFCPCLSTKECDKSTDGGISSSRKGREGEAYCSSSCAGCMYEVWKAPATASFTVILAPLLLAKSCTA